MAGKKELPFALPSCIMRIGNNVAHLPPGKEMIRQAFYRQVLEDREFWRFLCKRREWMKEKTLLSFLFKMTGVWTSYPLTEGIVALAGTIFYKKQGGKRNVQRNAKEKTDFIGRRDCGSFEPGDIRRPGFIGR
ncbi:MAG: hypothetical protein K2N80_12130 [Lachnospiraceae bacterium]|nr:hypothetical protein [Lachnospiraceae bacterium]